MCSRSVGSIVRAPRPKSIRRLSRRLPVGRWRLDPHLERHPALPDGRPEERVDGGGHGQAELVQDGRGLLLASGSIRIVVAGMFDGMASPLLVYRDATILPSLCGGFGPVVHVGRQDVEQITDAAPAHAVGELSRDRALGGAGIGRHEGSAPLEPGEVRAEVLRRHALKRLHEGIEERMDGVDPVDGPLGTVLGIVGRVCGDLEFREDVDIGGRLVRRHDGSGRDAVAQRVYGAFPRQDVSSRDLEKRLVRVVHAGHDADLLA